jgi:hypothetical protein
MRLWIVLDLYSEKSTDEWRRRSSRIFLNPSSVRVSVASCAPRSASARAVSAPVGGVPRPPDGNGVSSSSCAVADA